MMITDTPSDTFRSWLEEMSFRLARFEDNLAPAGMQTDFSRTSLDQLEEYLLARWPSQQAFLEDRDADFADCAVSYIGETYLRAAGGGWHFSDAEDFVFRGRPFVQLDTMDRTPISPFNLMTAALKRRTGHELTKVYDFQQENIADRRAEESPDWQPRRDPVPGVNRGSAAEEAASSALVGWLEGMADRLELVRSRASDGADRFDLSPDSLPALSALVLDDFGAVEELKRAASQPRAEAYASYFGEVLRHAAGGDWHLRPGEPDEYNPYVGRPYLERRLGSDEDIAEVPSLRMEQLVEEREVAVLTRAFSRYA